MSGKVFMTKLSREFPFANKKYFKSIGNIKIGHYRCKSRKRAGIVNSMVKWDLRTSYIFFFFFIVKFIELGFKNYVVTL